MPVHDGPRRLSVGCILGGDWEADLDCTAWHQANEHTCCKWCNADEHCGMCDRFDPDDFPMCVVCHEFPARAGPLCAGCGDRTPTAGELLDFEELDDEE